MTDKSETDRAMAENLFMPPGYRCPDPPAKGGLAFKVIPVYGAPKSQIIRTVPRPEAEIAEIRQAFALIFGRPPIESEQIECAVAIAAFEGKAFDQLSVAEICWINSFANSIGCKITWNAHRDATIIEPAGPAMSEAVSHSQQETALSRLARDISDIGDTFKKPLPLRYPIANIAFREAAIAVSNLGVELSRLLAKITNPSEFGNHINGMRKYLEVETKALRAATQGEKSGISTEQEGVSTSVTLRSGDRFVAPVRISPEGQARVDMSKAQVFRVSDGASAGPTTFANIEARAKFEPMGQSTFNNLYFGGNEAPDGFVRSDDFPRMQPVLLALSRVQGRIGDHVHGLPDLCQMASAALVWADSAIRVGRVLSRENVIDELKQVFCAAVFEAAAPVDAFSAVEYAIGALEGLGKVPPRQPGAAGSRDYHASATMPSGAGRDAVPIPVLYGQARVGIHVARLGVEDDPERPIPPALISIKRFRELEDAERELTAIKQGAGAGDEGRLHDLASAIIHQAIIMGGFTAPVAAAAAKAARNVIRLCAGWNQSRHRTLSLDGDVGAVRDRLAAHYGRPVALRILPARFPQDGFRWMDEAIDLMAQGRAGLIRLPEMSLDKIKIIEQAIDDLINGGVVLTKERSKEVEDGLARLEKFQNGDHVPVQADRLQDLEAHEDFRHRFDADPIGTLVEWYEENPTAILIVDGVERLAKDVTRQDMMTAREIRTAEGRIIKSNTGAPGSRAFDRQSEQAPLAGPAVQVNPAIKAGPSIAWDARSTLGIPDGR